MSSFSHETDCKSTPSVSGATVADSSTAQTPKGPRKIKLLLDRSGSMETDGLFQALIKGVNSLLLEQRQQAEEFETNPTIEVWVFDTSLDLIRSGPIKDVTDILENEVKPRGATALNDAMASILDNGKDDSDVLFFIFTDGQENSSTKHRGDSGRQYCKSLVEVYSRDKNWTIIFGAANIDAYQTGAQYGISADNAFNVEADAPTVTNMMRAVSGAVRTSSSHGGPVDISLIRQASAPSRVEGNQNSLPSGPPLVEHNLMLQRSNVDSVFCQPPVLRRAVANGQPSLYDHDGSIQGGMTSFNQEQVMMARPDGLSHINVDIADK